MRSLGTLVKVSLLGGLLLLSLGAPVLAASEDSAREVGFHAALSKFFSLVSLRKDGTGNGAVRSALSFSASVLGLPRFRVGYIRLNGTGTLNSTTLASFNGSGYAYTYRVALLRLVEFNDATPVGDSSSFVNFKNSILAWSDFKLTKVEGETSDDTMYVVTSRYKRLDSPLTVDLEIVVPTRKRMFRGGVITPNALKYSVNVSNFDYKMPNSRLALVLGLWSREITVDAALRNFSADTIRLSNGRFTWDTSVVADGKNVSVNLTKIIREEVETDLGDLDVLSRERSQTMIFAVNATQPKSVFWDPTLSVDDQSLDKNDDGVPSAALPRASLSYVSLLLCLLAAIFLAL